MADTSATIRLKAIDQNVATTLGDISTQASFLTAGSIALQASFGALEKVSKSTFAQFALGVDTSERIAGGLGKIASTSSAVGAVIGKLGDAAFLGSQAALVGQGIATAAQEWARIPATLASMQASGVSTKPIEDFNTLTEAVKGSGASIESFVTSSIAQLGQFEAAAARAGTILRSSTRFTASGSAERASQAEQLQNAFQVQKLVNTELDNTVSSTAALSAQYDVLSSGFTKAADSQKVLGAGLKLVGIGQAGGMAAPVGETTRLLTSTMNAYEYTADQASEVAGVLNNIVESGLTTIPELLDLGATAKQASAAGVSLKDLGASVSVLTSQGVNTAESLTGLAGVTGNIINKTPQAQEALDKLSISGQKIRFDKAEIQAKGLVQALIDVNQATGGSAQKLAEIFPDEVSYRTVLALLAQSGEKLKTVREGFESAGTKSLDDVFKIASEDRLSRMTQIVNRFQEAIIQIAASLAPVLEPGLKTLENIGGFFNSMPDWVKSGIGAWIAAQIQFRAGGAAMGAVVDTLKSLATNYLITRGASLLLTGQLGKEIGIVKDLFTQRKGLAAVGLQIFGVDQRWRLTSEAATEALTKQSAAAQLLANARSKLSEVVGKNVQSFQQQRLSSESLQQLKETGGGIASQARDAVTTGIATATNEETRKAAIATSEDLWKATKERAANAAQEISRSAQTIGTGLGQATGIIPTPQILGPDGKPLSAGGLQSVTDEFKRIGGGVANAAQNTFTGLKDQFGQRFDTSGAGEKAKEVGDAIAQNIADPDAIKDRMAQVQQTVVGEIDSLKAQTIKEQEAMTAQARTLQSTSELSNRDIEVRQKSTQASRDRADWLKIEADAQAKTTQASEIASRVEAKSLALTQQRSQASELFLSQTATREEKQKALNETLKQEQSLERDRNRLQAIQAETETLSTKAIDAKAKAIESSTASLQTRLAAEERLEPVARAMVEADTASTTASQAKQAATVAAAEATQLEAALGIQDERAIASRTQARVLGTQATNLETIATQRATTANRLYTAQARASELAEKGLAEARVLGTTVMYSTQGPLGGLNRLLATQIDLISPLQRAFKSGFSTIEAITVGSLNKAKAAITAFNPGIILSSTVKGIEKAGEKLGYIFEPITQPLASKSKAIADKFSSTIGSIKDSASNIDLSGIGTSISKATSTAGYITQPAIDPIKNKVIDTVRASKVVINREISNLIERDSVQKTLSTFSSSFSALEGTTTKTIQSTAAKAQQFKTLLNQGLQQGLTTLGQYREKAFDGTVNILSRLQMTAIGVSDATTSAVSAINTRLTNTARGIQAKAVDGITYGLAAVEQYKRKVFDITVNVLSRLQMLAIGVSNATNFASTAISKNLNNTWLLATSKVAEVVGIQKTRIIDTFTGIAAPIRDKGVVIGKEISEGVGKGLASLQNQKAKVESAATELLAPLQEKSATVAKEVSGVFAESGKRAAETFAPAIEGFKEKATAINDAVSGISRKTTESTSGTVKAFEEVGRRTVEVFSPVASRASAAIEATFAGSVARVRAAQASITSSLSGAIGAVGTFGTNTLTTLSVVGGKVTAIFGKVGQLGLSGFDLLKSGISTVLQPLGLFAPLALAAGVGAIAFRDDIGGTGAAVRDASKSFNEFQKSQAELTRQVQGQNSLAQLREQTKALINDTTYLGESTKRTAAASLAAQRGVIESGLSLPGQAISGAVGAVSGFFGGIGKNLNDAASQELTNVAIPAAEKLKPFRSELDQLRQSGAITNGQFALLSKSLNEVGTSGDVNKEKLKSFKNQLDAVMQGAEGVAESGIMDKLWGGITSIPGGLLDVFDNVLNLPAAFLNKQRAVLQGEQNIGSAIGDLFTGKGFAESKAQREADRLVKPISEIGIALEQTGNASLVSQEAIGKYGKGLAITADISEKIRKGTKLSAADLEGENQAFKNIQKTNQGIIGGLDEQIKKYEEVAKTIKDPEVKATFQGRIDALRAEREGLDKRNQKLKEANELLNKYQTETLPNLIQALNESSDPSKALKQAGETFKQQFQTTAEGKVSPYIKDIATLRQEAQRYQAQITDALATGEFDTKIEAAYGVKIVPGEAEAEAARKLQEVRDNQIKYVQDGIEKTGNRLSINDRKALTQQISELQNEGLKRQEAAGNLQLEREKNLQRSQVQGAAETEDKIAAIQKANLDRQLQQRENEIAEFKKAGFRTVDLENQAAQLRIQVEAAEIDQREKLRQRALDRRLKGLDLEAEKVKTAQARRTITGEEAEEKLADIQGKQAQARLNELKNERAKRGKPDPDLDNQIAQAEEQISQSEAQRDDNRRQRRIKRREGEFQIEQTQLKTQENNRTISAEAAQKRSTQIEISAAQARLQDLQQLYEKSGRRDIDLVQDIAKQRLEIERIQGDAIERERQRQIQRREAQFDIESAQVGLLAAKYQISQRDAERQSDRISIESAQARLQDLRQLYEKSGSTDIDLAQQITKARIDVETKATQAINKEREFQFAQNQARIKNEVQAEVLFRQQALNQGQIEQKDLELRNKSLDDAKGLINAQNQATEAQLQNVSKLTNDSVARAGIERQLAENRLANLGQQQQFERQSIDNQETIVRITSDREVAQARLQQLENQRDRQLTQNELAKAQRERRPEEEIRTIELQLQGLEQQNSLLDQQVGQAERSRQQQLDSLDNQRQQLDLTQATARENATIETAQARINQYQATLAQATERVSLAEQARQQGLQQSQKANEAIGRGLEQQLGFLEAQAKAVNARTEFATGELSLAADLTKNDAERKTIALAIADIKIKSTQQQIQYEQVVLELNQQQKQLQIESEKISNRVSQSQNLAEIAKARAELAKLMASPTASREDVFAAQLQLRAREQEGAGLKFQEAMLGRQQQLNAYTQQQERVAMGYQSQLRLDQAQAERVRALPEAQQDAAAAALKSQVLARGMGAGAGTYALPDINAARQNMQALMQEFQVPSLEVPVNLQPVRSQGYIEEQMRQLEPVRSQFEEMKKSFSPTTATENLSRRVSQLQQNYGQKEAPQATVQLQGRPIIEKVVIESISNTIQNSQQNPGQDIEGTVFQMLSNLTDRLQREFS